MTHTWPQVLALAMRKAAAAHRANAEQRQCPERAADGAHAQGRDFL
jgi:hypothetical protein